MLDAGPMVPAGLEHWTHFWLAQLDARSYGHSTKGKLYAYMTLSNASERIVLVRSLLFFFFQTLDGRTILLSTKPGEVLKNGCMKMVLNEGFPTYKDPFNKGRLIIVFAVEFPDSLSPEAAKKIAQALPKGRNVSVPADHEEVSMLEFDGKGNK